MLLAPSSLQHVCQLAMFMRAMTSVEPFHDWTTRPTTEHLLHLQMLHMARLFAKLGPEHVVLRIALCLALLLPTERLHLLQQGALQAVAEELRQQRGAVVPVLDLITQLQEDSGLEATLQASPAAALLKSAECWRAASAMIAVMLYQLVVGPKVTLADVQRGQLHRLLALGVKDGRKSSGGGTGKGSTGGPAGLAGPQVQFSGPAVDITRAKAAAIFRQLAARISKAQHDMHPAQEAAAEGAAADRAAAAEQQAGQRSPQRPLPPQQQPAAGTPLNWRNFTLLRSKPGAAAASPAGTPQQALRTPMQAGSPSPASPALAALRAATAAVPPSPSLPSPPLNTPAAAAADHAQAADRAQQMFSVYEGPLLVLYKVSAWHTWCQLP